MHRSSSKLPTLQQLSSKSILDTIHADSNKNDYIEKIDSLPIPKSIKANLKERREEGRIRKHVIDGFSFNKDCRPLIRPLNIPYVINVPRENAKQDTEYGVSILIKRKLQELQQKTSSELLQNNQRMQDKAPYSVSVSKVREMHGKKVPYESKWMEVPDDMVLMDKTLDDVLANNYPKQIKDIITTNLILFNNTIQDVALQYRLKFEQIEREKELHRAEQEQRNSRIAQHNSRGQAVNSRNHSINL